jgi:hypothetical protein
VALPNWLEWISLFPPTTHKAPRVPYYFIFLSLPPSCTDPSPSSFSSSSFLFLSSFFFACPSDPQRERCRETEREKEKRDRREREFQREILKDEIGRVRVRDREIVNRRARNPGNAGDSIFGRCYRWIYSGGT